MPFGWDQEAPRGTCFSAKKKPAPQAATQERAFSGEQGAQQESFSLIGLQSEERG